MWPSQMVNMAVRSGMILPAKIFSAAEKNDYDTEITLDHVRRIFIDHDYLKHPVADAGMNEETSIVNDGLQKNVQLQSGFQGEFGACSSSEGKVEVAPSNQGIEACDPGSLLDKFEEAIASLPSVLTPATSPGRSENWNEPLSLKISSQMDTADLTPPTTPPVQEQMEKSQIPAIPCKPSAKRLKETKKILVKKSLVGKSQGKNLKSAIIKKNAKTSSVFSKKVQQTKAKVGTAEPTKLHSKLTKRQNIACKMKDRDTISDSLPENKVKGQTESKFEIDNKVNENAEMLIKDTPMTESKDNARDKPLDSDNNNLNDSTCNCECSGRKSKTNDKLNGDIVMGKQLLKDKNEHQNKHGERVNSMKNENHRNEDICMEDKLLKVNESGLKETSKNSDAGAEMDAKIDSEIYKVCNNNTIDMKDNDVQYKSTNDGLKKTQNMERNAHEDSKSRHRANKDSTSRRLRRYSNEYESDRRKRQHRSRSSSIGDYSGDEGRSNRRRSERFRDSRKHSRDRRNEKYRKYSCRDDDVEEDTSHKERDADESRNPWKYFRDIEHERKIDFRLARSNTRDAAKGERRVIYVGGLPYGTTQDELWRRFRKFGPIERVTVHLRHGEGDNYGFVTFFEPDDAKECMERGNSDPSEPRFDLCFGGRRQFCGGSYVDFDSTTSQLEEMSETYGKACEDNPEEDDFDSLLRMYKKELRR